MRILTPQQVRDLPTLLHGHPLYAPVLVALSTGVRRRELLALREWQRPRPRYQFCLCQPYRPRPHTNLGKRVKSQLGRRYPLHARATAQRLGERRTYNLKIIGATGARTNSALFQSLSRQNWAPLATTERRSQALAAVHLALPRLASGGPNRSIGLHHQPVRLLAYS